MTANESRYEIQHETLADGWINTATDDDGNAVTYASKAEALEELSAFIAASLEAQANGDIEGFDPAQYRVAPIKADGRT